MATSFYRFLRRRVRRAVRAAAFAWIPLALATDVMAAGLRHFPGIPDQHVERLALALIHIPLFAAAFYYRVGAAAAAAAECACASPFFAEPSRVVLHIQISMEYSLSSLCFEALRSLGILCMSLVLLVCRVAQLISSCILCAPYACIVLLSLTCLGIL